MSKAEYRSSIRSKQLIQKALIDLLQEKQVDKITVSDVVRKAEINRGTFYAHYTDIPDVLNHMIMQFFSTIREAISDHPRRLTDIPHALMSRVQAILEADLDFCTKIMTSSASSLMYEQLVSTVLDYMIQQEERFGFGNHELYVLTVRFCAGGLSNLYRDWFAGKVDISLDELTRQAEAMLNRIIRITALSC